MLDFIYRLIIEFEDEHGISPNLIYINRFHAEHLKSAFDADYTINQIRDVLGMELFIENDITHPHVAWTHVATRAVAV